MITAYQRAEVVRLLRKLEVDSVTVGYRHRTFGVQDHMIGGPVDAWLDGLTSELANALIKRLRKDVDDVEDDD